MANDRVTVDDAGFARSDCQTFTIANGATGANNAPLNFDRNYAYFMVLCEDAQYIQASTNLSALVACEQGGTMCTLYERDDPSTQWSKGALPTSGTFAFAFIHALGAQYLRFVLSKAASGGAVVLKVYGIAESVK